MAEALILDSEALNALANRLERGVLVDRARAILALAMQRGARVRVGAAVIATGDVADIAALAASFKHVRVFGI